MLGNSSGLSRRRIGYDPPGSLTTSGTWLHFSSRTAPFRIVPVMPTNPARCLRGWVGALNNGSTTSAAVIAIPETRPVARRCRLLVVLAQPGVGGATTRWRHRAAAGDDALNVCCRFPVSRCTATMSCGKTGLDRMPFWARPTMSDAKLTQ